MKDNKLIAEFMGMKPLNNDSSVLVFSTDRGNDIVSIDNLQYQNDWNLLMEVVAKIESLGVVVEIRDNVCYIETSPANYYSELEETKIQATYKAVIEFIKWYNEQNIMINKIYCDICSQASVETLQIITEETFYCCTMCRDNNEDREIKDNNFYEDCVIDYKS